MAERREREYGKTKISKSFELLVEERGGGRNLELKWGGGEEEREREREREREYKREQEREKEREIEREKGTSCSIMRLMLSTISRGL